MAIEEILFVLVRLWYIVAGRLIVKVPLAAKIYLVILIVVVALYLIVDAMRKEWDIMKEYNIKLLHVFADDVFSGRKPFEIRKNDRDYALGDRIKFLVIGSRGNVKSHPITACTYEITYVLDGWGLKDGYVALGLRSLILTD